MLERCASKQQQFVSLTSFTYNERGLLSGGAENRQKKNPVQGLAANTGLRQGVNYPNSLLLWAIALYTSSEPFWEPIALINRRRWVFLLSLFGAISGIAISTVAQKVKKLTLARQLAYKVFFSSTT